MEGVCEREVAERKEEKEGEGKRGKEGVERKKNKERRKETPTLGHPIPWVRDKVNA